MQDENLSDWHKGLFGRIVQYLVLWLVKPKLMKHERVTVLSSREPTTKYCTCCGKKNTCGMQETFNTAFVLAEHLGAVSMNNKAPDFVCGG